MFFSQTYDSDRGLFTELGLNMFVADEHRGRIHLGTVETDWASVEVEVTCMPAQFWRFTITPKVEEPVYDRRLPSDVQAGVLETGSGALVDYWPVVEKWVSGMLVFTPPERNYADHAAFEDWQRRHGVGGTLAEPEASS